MLYKGLEDRFFGTPGLWLLRSEPESMHIWLENRPTDTEIGEIYSTYHTHQPSKRSNFLEPLHQLVSARLGYLTNVDKPLIAKFLSLLPSLLRASELDFMGLSSGGYSSVLDYGCGAGGLLKLLQANGKICYGYDPDPAALKNLDGTGINVLTSEDQIKSCNLKFDVIVLSHVIEHLPYPEKTLAHLSSKLAKNGRIVIVTPNSKSLGHRIFKQHWRGLEPPRHFNIFSPSSIRHIAANIGLSCEVRTESRIARGIFVTSALSALGQRKIELLPKQNRLLKLAGYLFQVVEHGLSSFQPLIGEELSVTLRQPGAPLDLPDRQTLTQV